MTGNDESGSMVEGQTFTIGECSLYSMVEGDTVNIITRKHNRTVVLSMNPYSMNLSFIAEPILTMGSIECVTWPDNWTTLTADGSPAAQFEHTILITRTGAEILTC